MRHSRVRAGKQARRQGSGQATRRHGPLQHADTGRASAGTLGAATTGGIAHERPTTEDVDRDRRRAGHGDQVDNVALLQPRQVGRLRVLCTVRPRPGGDKGWGSHELSPLLGVESEGT